MTNLIPLGEFKNPITPFTSVYLELDMSKIETDTELITDMIVDFLTVAGCILYEVPSFPCSVAFDEDEEGAVKKASTALTINDKHLDFVSVKEAVAAGLKKFGLFLPVKISLIYGYQSDGVESDFSLEDYKQMKGNIAESHPALRFHRTFPTLKEENGVYTNEAGEQVDPEEVYDGYLDKMEKAFEDYKKEKGE